jgi:hypothetical protein
MPVFLIDAEWAFVSAAVDRLILADAQHPGGVEGGYYLLARRRGRRQ